MSIQRNNIRRAAFILPLLLAGAVFFGCHDSIFEDIKQESAIGEDRIKGGATGFVVFKGHIYFAPTNEGVIYRKANNSSSWYNRGHWEAISCPEIPVYLATSDDGQTLYLLTTTFQEGTDDFSGVNMPTGYYEYTSTSGDSGSWSSRINSYKYGILGTDIPDRYKEQNTRVRAPSGKVYSVAANSNVLYEDRTPILYADQKDVKVGSWWCIAGTHDNLILGTSVGLFHMHTGSTDINDEVAPNDFSTAKSIFSGMTILSIYVGGTTKDSTGAWSCSDTSETSSVIYVFATGAGSSYAAQNGLYSYIPGQGWDSEF
ncbi:MAG: hypothetical protein ILP18_07630 [Treponema sp.]|nr:hypothetical protein [Treponema sp.]